MSRGSSGLNSSFIAKVVIVLLASFVAATGAYASQVVVNFATWGSPQAIEVWMRDIEAFERENPDIKINPIFSSWDQYWERVPFYLSGDIEVDVIRIGGQHLPTYAQQGFLLPLTPYAESGELELDVFFPAVLEGTVYNGTLYGLPDHFSPYVLYFNIGLFEEFGLENPYELYQRDAWTWEALEDLVRKLTIDLDGDGRNDLWAHAVFSVTDPYVRQAMILSNGGQIFNDDYTKYLLNEPQSIEALTWLAEMGRERGDWNGWYNGQVAMIASWPSRQNEFPGRIDFEFGVAPLPRPEDGQHATVMTTNILSILKQSKNPDAAMRFINYIVGEDVQTRRISDNYIVSARIDVALETLRDGRLPAKYNSVIADITEFTYPWAVPPIHYERVNNLVATELAKVDRGEEAVESAALRITEMVNAILAE